MPTFQLILHKTYYKTGFFNIRVDYDRYVDQKEGLIEIELYEEKIISARIDRSAQNNGTARIMGGAELRDFFQSKYKEGDTVDMDIVSPNYIKIIST